MPRGRAGTRPGDLIERERELEEIDLSLRDALAGDGRVLLIEGPPGIGKTALLDAARQRAHSDGLVTLAARGGELERHFPYGVVRQLFEPVLRQASAAARRKLLSGAARLAAPVVAGEGDPVSAGGADADSAFGLMHGLYWLTVHLSQQAPTLLVVDDMQWADGPSLRFLLYLSRRLEGAPASLLVSTRDERERHQSDFAAQLAADPRARVLRPAALSQAAVARLLQDGLGSSSDEAFAAACRTATGGVPFLVGELVAALAADQIEPTGDQAKQVQALGPRNVARATLVRLGRMPAGSVALARAVAVLAADAQLPRAARLAGLEETGALQALDALVEAHVLQADAHLAFVHPILRAAIYDELARGERSELHRRAARLLAEEGAELDAVAAQLLASEPTGSEEVVAQLREAAALALARGAPENGVAYLSRALEEGCERELRARISFELATAARLAGQRSMVRYFQDAHRLAEDPVLRNSAALELATVLGLRGDWQEPIALLRGALADLGDAAPELAVRCECLLAGMSASDPQMVAGFDRRLPELEALAERGGAPAHPLSLLLAGVAAWRGRDASQVTALVSRGWDEAHGLATGGDLWALGQGVGALVVSEELRYARQLSDALLAGARRRGSLLGFVLGSTYSGWIEARSGRLSTAEEGLRVPLGQARRRLNFPLASQLWFATDVILERPQAADLAARAEAVELGSLAEVFSGAMLLEVRGRVRHAAGDTAAGIEDMRHAGEIFAGIDFRNPNASSWRSALALMLPAKEQDEAKRLASEELKDARRIGHARAIGVAQRALGLIEGGAPGRRRLEQSVAALADSPARLEHARSLLELGAALRRAGERSAAREPLRMSLDLAVAAGATRLGERARTELAASGARPRRERATGRDALTPSELRVARLAAEGRTNNEIAQHLFVTPKTVDTHLSHAYAKLDISSRHALAAALEDQTEGAVAVGADDG